MLIFALSALFGFLTTGITEWKTILCLRIVGLRGLDLLCHGGLAPVEEHTMSWEGFLLHRLYCYRGALLLDRVGC